MIKILAHKINYHKNRRYKVNFRPLYDALPANQQARFRFAVMASQKWHSRAIFYNAMRGENWISGETVEDIKSIFIQFGKEVETEMVNRNDVEYRTI